MIEVTNVTKRYGEKVAVSDLYFVLDAPSSGRTVVNGKPYREHAAPLHEVGALLEARSVHTGRSAYNHLLAMAQTHATSRDRVRAPRRSSHGDAR